MHWPPDDRGQSLVPETPSRACVSPRRARINPRVRRAGRPSVRWRILGTAGPARRGRRPHGGGHPIVATHWPPEPRLGRHHGTILALRPGAWTTCRPVRSAERLRRSPEADPALSRQGVEMVGAGFRHASAVGVLLSALLAFLCLGTVRAQDSPVAGHPAHIHAGTCADLDPNPLAPLKDVTGV